MQGKRILISALTSCALFAYFAPAFAEMSVPEGWYLEANVGSSQINNANFPSGTSTSGIGGGGSIGYKFVPYFGAEIGGNRYSNNTIKYTGIKIATVKPYSYFIALRGIVPFSNSGFEGFAKVGAGRMVVNLNPTNNVVFGTSGLSSSQHSQTGLYWGVGADYFFMPEFGANIQFQRQNGDSSTGNASLLSVGLDFIFD